VWRVPIPNRYTAKAKLCFCKNNKRRIITLASESQEACWSHAKILQPSGCVFITAVPIIKLFARGEGDSGGHVRAFWFILSVFDMLSAVNSSRETSRDSQQKGGRASIDNCWRDGRVVDKKNRLNCARSVEGGQCFAYNTAAQLPRCSILNVRVLSLITAVLPVSVPS
jgi:hypothetical protein